MDRNLRCPTAVEDSTVDADTTSDMSPGFGHDSSARLHNPRIRHGFLVKASIALLLMAAASVSTVNAGDSGRFVELARHWAPVIRQDTAHSRHDFITRFDFDGNTDGGDNWDNTDKNPLPAWVYYAVVETSTHWFLTYAMFHPRDWDRVNTSINSHENDLEGILLAVERDGSQAGRLVLMETVFHLDFYQYTDQPDVQSGPEDIDDILRREGHHPVLQIESRGHGIKGWNGGAFPGGDGVVYRFGGSAEEPSSASDSDVSYDLVSIEATLWAHRYEVGTGKMYGKDQDYRADRFGYAFYGTRYGDHKANAPWGWDDHNDQDVDRGDIFMNPAATIQAHVTLEHPISLDYTVNPYLNGDESTGIRVSARQTQFEALYQGL